MQQSDAGQQEKDARLPVKLVRRLALGAIPLIFGFGFLIGVLFERWQGG